MTVNINAGNSSSVRLVEQSSVSAPSGSAARVYVNNATPRRFSMVDSSGVTTFIGNTSGSGTGITFPNTQDPSTNINTLDDYEEGTWSPILIPASGAFGTIIYDALNVAAYTKIGRVVYVQGAIRTDSISLGTASGAVSIDGLPFTVSSLASSQSLSIGSSAAFAGEEPSAGFFVVSTTTISLLYRSAADDETIALDVSDLTLTSNANFVRFGGFYFV